MTTENNALRPKIDQTIETGFDVLTHENETDKKQHVIRHVDASLIQFHFCFRRSATFHFNERTYSLPILDEHVLLLYNPQRDLPMELDVAVNTQLVTVLISIKKFHSLFSQEAEQISFLSDENVDKKYSLWYFETSFSSSIINIYILKFKDKVPFTRAEQTADHIKNVELDNNAKSG